MLPGLESLCKVHFRDYEVCTVRWVCGRVALSMLGVGLRLISWVLGGWRVEGMGYVVVVLVVRC